MWKVLLMWPSIDHHPVLLFILVCSAVSQEQKLHLHCARVWNRQGPGWWENDDVSREIHKCNGEIWQLTGQFMVLTAINACKCKYY